MTNNEVLRRLRFTFDYGDSKMVAVFAAADHTVTQDQIKNWLISDEDPAYEQLGDTDLAFYLNGLIIEKRGKRPGPQPVAETRLSSNLVVMKLKIALNLKSEDMMEILGLAGFQLSNHELSAFFRKPGHKHYRVLKDQVLRYFMRGLQMKYRPSLQDNDE